ncbi:MAG: hypothetical protein DMF94_34585 [Acidobacteria bacterium]|nr:MAG: hypothetical protein DMF94_34585 [Acidobacteriota bacterium]
MRITIAICTFNRSALLRQCLDQMARMLVPPEVSLELLVVNNNCTDDTDAVLEEFAQTLPLRRVFEPAAGLSNARNAALAEATGEYILFTDDDVLVAESWLVEFMNGIRRYPHAAAIGGVIEPWFPCEPDPNLLRAFPELRTGFCGLDHNCPPGPLAPPATLYGANMAYRMAAIDGHRFNLLLGPTPDSSGAFDEVEFLERLRARGGEVIWWPAMTLRHYVDPSRMTRSYLLRYALHTGRISVVMGSLALARTEKQPPPRWLWRRCAETYLAAFLGSYVLPARLLQSTLFTAPLPSGGSRKVRSLALQRQYFYIRGMIEGHRQLGASTKPRAF